MEKTYFEQLTDLVNSIENPDRMTQYVIEDVVHRALSYRDGHDEYIAWDHSSYMLRQLTYLREWLDKNN